MKSTLNTEPNCIWSVKGYKESPSGILHMHCEELQRRAKSSPQFLPRFGPEAQPVLQEIKSILPCCLLWLIVYLVLNLFFLEFLELFTGWPGWSLCS